MRSLVDGLSCFIMTTIAGRGFTGVQANLLTKTCQNKDPQNSFKQADEGKISPANEAQNPYKLPLKLELTVFTEKPDASANNVIGYQYRFGDNR